METKTRTIVRHISWRLFSLVPSFFISYFVTESFIDSIVIGAVGGFARLLFHYVHDRAWINVTWGHVNYIETKIRTIIRIFTWRLTVFVVTFIASWIIIGNISESLEIGIIDTVVKFIFHYIHERSWLCLKWGIVNVHNIPDDNVESAYDSKIEVSSRSPLPICDHKRKKIKLFGSNLTWSIDPNVHFYCLQDNFPAYEFLDDPNQEVY